MREREIDVGCEKLDRPGQWMMTELEGERERERELQAGGGTGLGDQAVTAAGDAF